MVCDQGAVGAHRVPPTVPRQRPIAPSSVPVLFVTGFAVMAALTSAGAGGANAVVLKPFRDGELERKVAAALAARSAPGLRLVSDRGRSA